MHFFDQQFLQYFQTQVNQRSSEDKSIRKNLKHCIKWFWNSQEPLRQEHE